MIIKLPGLFFPKISLFRNKINLRVKTRGFSSDVKSIITKPKLEYLLILDFEATCDRSKIVQEIIEFPCVKWSLATLKEEGRFHKYVRPIRNPKLSNFCVELTGILQEMVEGEKVFSETFEDFQQWRTAEGLTDENSLYVTSGDWDLGKMLPSQCELSNLRIPPHMMEWLNIKRYFSIYADRYFGSLLGIIKACDLEFVGRPHSGIDDCMNICNIVKKLAVTGIKFRPTTQLVRGPFGYEPKPFKVELLGNTKRIRPMARFSKTRRKVNY